MGAVSPEPRACVLLVEDEPSIRELLRLVISAPDLEVVTAGTFADAMRELRQRCPDVVVADKNLPDGSGLDVVAAARAADSLVECILITGYPSLETAVAAIEHLVFDYIVKPFPDIRGVARRVRQALARRRLHQENLALVLRLQEQNVVLETALAEQAALRDELVQSEKLAGIGVLAAGIAHEVNSPLFGILGLAEAITDEPDLAAAQGYAREIVGYCGGIQEIVGGLTSYSRESRNDPVEAVDLAQVTRDALRLVRRAVPCEGVQLGMDAHAATPRVRGRAGELQQVLVNLVRNAVEAVREPGGARGAGRPDVRVTLGPDERSGWVRLRVEDNGPGLSEEAKRRVFDPFYTTKPPGQGTGLGLNVAWRIVTRAQGSLLAGASPSGGASFELRLPAWMPPSRGTAADDGA
jgi:two-component system NtrC family sensor kinase